jgi:hypothetical protein
MYLRTWGAKYKVVVGKWWEEVHGHSHYKSCLAILKHLKAFTVGAFQIRPYNSMSYNAFVMRWETDVLVLWKICGANDAPYESRSCTGNICGPKKGRVCWDLTDCKRFIVHWLRALKLKILLKGVCLIFCFLFWCAILLLRLIGMCCQVLGLFRPMVVIAIVGYWSGSL